MPKKRQWRDDSAWWEIVRARYRQPKEPTRWARELRIDKSTLSNKVNGKAPINAEEALAISRLLKVAPPRGLLDELHRRAIAAIEFARSEGVDRAEIAAQVKRLERACARLVNARREWDDEESPAGAAPLDESA